ncbi:MAG: hypothetical protein JNK38_18800 [Acidobacteria bacterium]|nr:hypothetical protein [Acidobacteriota bacterium]
MFKRFIRKIIFAYPIYQIYVRFRAWQRDWRYHKVVKANSLPLYAETIAESLYRDLIAVELFRELRLNAQWLNATLIPTGGAADYKRLYLLLRVLTELSPGSVIEFGAGQTTKILSAYKRHSGADVVTIEHDPFWSEQVQQSLSTSTYQLHCCPLIEFNSPVFGSYHWYDLSKAGEIGSRKFNVFLIDGPVGAAKWSRVGIVKAFFDLNAGEWLVIWDDLHRAADLESFAAFIQALRERKLEFGYAIFNGLKKVGVVYTNAFRAVGHYF